MALFVILTKEGSIRFPRKAPGDRLLIQWMLPSSASQVADRALPFNVSTLERHKCKRPRLNYYPLTSFDWSQYLLHLLKHLIVKYLYYALYRILLNVKTNNIPAFTAVALMSLFEFLNIVTILQFLPNILTINYSSKEQGELTYITAGIILVIINYFFLLNDLPYLNERYQNDSKNKRVLGTILVISYGVISILAACFSPVTRN